MSIPSLPEVKWDDPYRPRINRCIILHYGMPRHHAEYEIGEVIQPFNPHDRRITYIGEDEYLHRTEGLARITPWVSIGATPSPTARHLLRARFGEPKTLKEALNEVDFAYGT